jgi:hypothetical protein
MFSGTGATATYAEPYDLLGVHVQVGLGRVFDVGPGLFLEPQLQVGNLWVSRNFTGSDSLRAFTFTPAIELGAAPSDAFRVGLRVETSVFAARLEGSRQLHAAGAIRVAGRLFVLTSWILRSGTSPKRSVPAIEISPSGSLFDRGESMDHV